MHIGQTSSFDRPSWPVASSQLGEKMCPFVVELAGCHDHGSVSALPVPDLGRVERVATLARLVEDACKVAVERGDGIAALAKAIELRVVPVAVGPSREHGAGEQTLTPERHQPTGVEVMRMERPEPHIRPCSRILGRPALRLPLSAAATSIIIVPSRRFSLTSSRTILELP
jgi:hypothetical protein